MDPKALRDALRAARGDPARQPITERAQTFGGFEHGRTQRVAIDKDLVRKLNLAGKDAPRVLPFRSSHVWEQHTRPPFRGTLRISGDPDLREGFHRLAREPGALGTPMTLGDVYKACGIRLHGEFERHYPLPEPTYTRVVIERLEEVRFGPHEPVSVRVSFVAVQ